MRNSKKKARHIGKSEVQQHHQDDHSIKQQAASLGVKLFALLAIVIWFLAILAAAIFLGQVLHWVEAQQLLANWMIWLGKGVEGAIYVMDCVGLLYAVWKHI